MGDAHRGRDLDEAPLPPLPPWAPEPQRPGRANRTARFLTPPLAVSGAVTALVVLGFYSLMLLDEARHSDSVLPGVTVAGEDLSGLPLDTAKSQVLALADTLETEPIRLDVDGHEVLLDPWAARVRVDANATWDRVSGHAREGTPVQRFADWAVARTVGRTVPLDVTWDPAQAREALAALEFPGRIPVTEPSATVIDGRPVVEPGTAGHLMDVDAALLAVRDAISDPDRDPVMIPTQDPKPRFDEARAGEALDRALEVVDRPIDVRVGPVSATATREDLWATLRPVTDGDRYDVGIDDEALVAVLGPRLPPTIAPTDAYLAAGEQSIGVVPGRPGLGCCGEGSGDAVMAALAEPGTTEVRLEKGAIPPAVTSSHIGVPASDLLGEFTTRYTAGQARVQNIQKMADLLNGSIVQPGESFSINDTVGPRTLAGGWVPAGTIVEGKLEPTPGGGISQYATTLYNALFFAGLRIDEHKPHSIYFSRYPLGREATMGYPRPDLEFTNDTAHPLVLWSTYDDRSITVQVWGTADGRRAEALEPVVTGYGACRTVRVTREITWPDGSVTRESDRHSYKPEADEEC